MSNQVFIGTAEVLVAKEAIVCRKRGWMSRSEHQMLVSVDERTLFLGISSPQNEYQVLALFCQGTDSSIGKLFPAFALVRAGLVRTDRKGRVE